MLTFFGLTSKDKIQIHEGIFSMVMHGKGGWTHSELYDMPIYLRNFYMNKLADMLSKEANAASNSINNGPTKKIYNSNFSSSPR